MNPASIASAIVGAQSGLTRLSLGAAVTRMNADRGAAMVKLIDVATANVNSLANAGTGVGRTVNISI